MRSKSVLAVFLLSLLTLPLTVHASTGTSLTQSELQFLTDLEVLIPTVLFVLSLLALRNADYEYAFVLLLASVIAVVGIASVTGGVPQGTGFAVTQLSVNVTGQSSLNTGQSGTYTAVWSPSMPANVTWLVTVNGSTVENVTQHNVNPGTSLTVQFSKAGVYTVSALVVNREHNAVGVGAEVVKVTPPPSPLGWVEGAIVGAFNDIVSFFEGIINAVVSLVNFFIDPIQYLLYNPLPQEAPAVQTLYSEMLGVSTGIALLMLSFSVVYNAIKGYYEDIVDIASDLFYKLGVWLMFTFGGLEIYTVIASFFNNLISTYLSQYLVQASIDVYIGLATYSALSLILSGMPFGLGGVFVNAMGEIGSFLLFSSALAMLRYALMLAIVTTMPLWATLWLFEWTRGIAVRIADTLVGMVIGGFLSAVTLAVLVALPFGNIFMMLAPIVLDSEFLLSFFYFAFSGSPSELKSRVRARSIKVQQPAGTQTPQTPPPAPAPQPQPQPVPVPQRNLAYI